MLQVQLLLISGLPFDVELVNRLLLLVNLSNGGLK